MNTLKIRVENCPTSIAVRDSVNPPLHFGSPKTVVITSTFPGIKVSLLTPIHYEYAWNAATKTKSVVDFNGVILEAEPYLVRSWFFFGFDSYVSQIAQTFALPWVGVNGFIFPAGSVQDGRLIWYKDLNRPYYQLNSNVTFPHHDYDWKKLDELPEVDANPNPQYETHVRSDYLLFNGKARHYHARWDGDMVTITPDIFGTYEYVDEVITSVSIMEPPEITMIDERRSLANLSSTYETGKVRILIEPLS